MGGARAKYHFAFALGRQRKFPDTIRREKTSSKKGRLTVTEEHLTPDDLEELGRLFEGIATDLFYLTSKHIPKLEDKL